MKVCNACGEEKSIDQFSKHAGRCKPCKVVAQRAYVAADPEKISAINARSYRKHAEKRAAAAKVACSPPSAARTTPTTDARCAARERCGGRLVSPRFLTAIRFQAAARENGWRLVPCSDGRGPCGARKGSYVVMIQENRVGGLSGVWFTYPVRDGWRSEYLGPRSAGKLDKALRFLQDPTCRGGIVGNPSGAYARRQHGRGEPDPTLF